MDPVKYHGLNNGYPIASLSDRQLSHLIMSRVPDGTYQSVYVTSDELNVPGKAEKIKGRRITLERAAIYNWLDAIKCFFETLFRGSNSTQAKYLPKIDATGIQQHLLGHYKDADEKREFEQVNIEELKKAYCVGAKIEIEIADDCSYATMSSVTTAKVIVNALAMATWIRKE